MDKRVWCMHRIRWGAAALLLAVTSCAPSPGPSTQQSGPPSAAEQERIGKAIRDYFSKTVNLPPDLTLTVKDIVPAEVPGTLKGSIEVSAEDEKQELPFLISSDGRYFTRGQFVDLTVDPLKATMAKISLKDKAVRGPADAPVTIVEYSDYQCPYCRRAYETVEQQVLKEYAGKVKFVFKNLPLTAIHPWAEPAAIAAECAGLQGPEAFWKVYDGLFQNQEQITPDNLKDRVLGIAQGAGLDSAKLGQCIEGKQTQAQVDADQQEANALGVQSTPTFFINGRRLEGAVPLENFKDVIDQALNAGASS